MMIACSTNGPLFSNPPRLSRHNRMLGSAGFGWSPRNAAISLSGFDNGTVCPKQADGPSLIKTTSRSSDGFISQIARITCTRTICSNKVST